MDTNVTEMVIELAKLLAVIMIATSFISTIGGVVKMLIVYRSRLYWEFITKLVDRFYTFIEKF